MTTQGGSYTAPHVLVTLPLGVLKHEINLFTPALPPRYRTSIDNLGFGLLNKIVVFYDHVWWPKSESWFSFLPNPSENPEDQTMFGSLSKSYKNSSIGVMNMYVQKQIPALLFFLSGDAAEYLKAFADDTRIKARIILEERELLRGCLHMKAPGAKWEYAIDSVVQLRKAGIDIVVYVSRWDCIRPLTGIPVDQTPQ